MMGPESWDLSAYANEIYAAAEGNLSCRNGVGEKDKGMSTTNRMTPEALPLAALYTLSPRRRKKMTSISSEALVRRLTFGLAIAGVLVLILGGALGYLVRP